MTEFESSHPEGPASGPTIQNAPVSEIVRAEIVGPIRPPHRILRRRIGLPLVLFLLTCLSTFFAGATGWMPIDFIFAGFNRVGGFDLSGPTFLLPARIAILENWQNGLIYMGCVLSILLAHEMGHFVMTLVYRVRASLPLCIPLPVSPIGTMGAVIVMDGSQADRRQIFDIGLAGPLAGLVVAIPIVYIGAMQLDFAGKAAIHEFGLPLAVRWLIQWLHPGAAKDLYYIGVNQLNPYFMAGWVGLLVTGLNMLPVSQLDGGHVTYALLGRKAHWLARLFMLAVFGFMAWNFLFLNRPPMWIVMALLVLLMGTDHPPTRDDSVSLGWFRTGLGYLSLLIPVFCFAPNLVR